ncbi:MAG: universal stress protein [Actinomycetota bacterium]|nr:universal stress protein [Actinomycetota bacterium]
METIAVGLSDPASQKAIDWVIDRARTRKIEVTLVAAYDWFLTPLSEITELLRAARARIAVKSPRTVVHVAAVEDDAVAALVAASEEVDLLVIGAHLRQHLASLGEAPALRVARRARSATVIVPEEWKPTSRGVVIVGSDDDSSDSAIAFAEHEAEDSGAQLEVVRAWTSPMPAYDPLVWIVDTEGERRISNRESLDAVIDRVKTEHPTARVRGLLAECLPVAALHDRGGHADLVVIGSHRRGPIATWIVGSTARELLTNMLTPLCIVPRAHPTR